MFDFHPQLKQRFAALRTGAEFFPYGMYASPASTCRCARTSPSHQA